MSAISERGRNLEQRVESIFREYCQLHSLFNKIDDASLSAEIIESFTNQEKQLRMRLSSVSRVLEAWKRDYLSTLRVDEFGFESAESLIYWKKKAKRHNIDCRNRIERLMVSVKSEINGLTVPRNRKSIYARETVPGLIDISQ